MKNMNKLKAVLASLIKTNKCPELLEKDPETGSKWSMNTVQIDFQDLSKISLLLGLLLNTKSL